MVACGVQGPWVDGGGELPGAGSAGDGHACLPAAPVRAINDDPVVTSEGGLLAQRARRRCDTCVETLVQQARTPTMSSTHGHAFLELCYASDSEVAAVVVEHSVVIRVTSVEDVQLTSMRPAQSLAYEVVANIWVSIPCIAGTPFRCINEKLDAETGDLAMTYKLEVTAVGLCRHDVRIGGGFSCEWSNGNELWDLVVVRNLLFGLDNSCGTTVCRSRGMFKKVTGAAHAHVFHHQLRAAKDNAGGNGFNSSVQPYAMAVHSDSLRYAAEEAFLRFAGNAVDAKFCNGCFVYINAWRNITTDPIENNYLAVCNETALVAPDDYLASDLFMPGVRFIHYGLSDHNASKHRWYYFPKMQMDEVLLFKQFESDTALPGCMTFHTAFVDPTVRPDGPERQSIECSAFMFFLDFEPKTCPALPSDAVAKEVAFHAERGTWDLWRVRESSEWMRDDAFSEVIVGRVFVILGVKFAERLLIWMQRPATTAVIVDLTVLRTPRGEWNICGNSLPCWAA